MSRVRVLVVDDSSIFRKALSQALTRDPEIEVVGTAADPYEARDKIAELNPDVITLDMEMPRMDGLTFLKRIMQYRPMPVVVISAHTQEGAPRALEALQAGAIAVVCKPSGAYSLDELSVDLTAIVRQAPNVKIQAVKDDADTAPRTTIARSPGGIGAGQLIAIGASTGGTVAIEEILLSLPPEMPPIVIAQHMPPFFTKSYAQRLDRLASIRVREAEDGESILPGQAAIAPGGKHLVVRQNGAGYRLQVRDGPLVSGHKPSVDVLLRSVAEAAGPKAIGLLLTGMGKDGARGLTDMHNAGAHTIAQDEASSVVWGMPKAAIDLGGADEVLPLNRMATTLVRWSAQPVPPSAIAGGIRPRA